MLTKEYLDNPRMSQSKLKRILDGVEEFKYALDNPEPATDARTLGDAVHTLILEPHKSSRIAKLPKINGTTREGKIFKLLLEGKGPNYFPITSKTKKQEAGKFYEVDKEEMDFILKMGDQYGHVFSHPEKFIILDEVEYEKAHRMAEAAFKNEDTSYILKSAKHYEKMHQFEYLDIPFKCQLDGEGTETIECVPEFILDLKTTIIANDDYAIRNEIRKRRYHFQAACYRQAFGLQFEIIYYILFVRSVPPYAVFPVQLSEALSVEGLIQFNDACLLYRDCSENNKQFIPNNRLRII